MHHLLKAELKADFPQLLNPPQHALKLVASDGRVALLRRACAALSSLPGTTFPSSVRASNGGVLWLHLRRPKGADADGEPQAVEDLIFEVAEESKRICEACGEDGDGRYMVYERMGWRHFRMCRECLDLRTAEDRRRMWRLEEDAVDSDSE